MAIMKNNEKKKKEEKKENEMNKIIMKMKYHEIIKQYVSEKMK
jgi:hypothetical protein